MNDTDRSFAVVTGASSGIGLEIARECAQNGFDLLIAADRPLAEAVNQLTALGAQVDAVEVDLSTQEGVDTLYAATRGRAVDALFANAGHGLGHAFLDEDYAAARHVIDTNITGTTYLIHRIGRDMRARGRGRILITGSIAASCRAPFRRSTTAPRPSSIRSRGRCATSSRTPASPSPA